MSNQPSRVRYRGSVASAALGLWDGLAFLSIGWFTTSAYHDGVFDERYGVLLLVLLVAMGVTYGRFGVYAPYGRFPNETIALVKAWLVAFGVLPVIAFLAKETEASSRFVVVLFSRGLTAQWVGQRVFRLIRHRLERAPRLESAIVFGRSAVLGAIERWGRSSAPDRGEGAAPTTTAEDQRQLSPVYQFFGPNPRFCRRPAGGLCAIIA